MKCSKCGKNNANITYNQNINGEVTNLNLCEECAHKLGIFNSFDDIFSPMVLDLDYILPEEIKCKKCGYTLSKYRNSGLFGCDSCYDTFKNEIDSILLKLQGKNRNVQKLESNKNDKPESQEEKLRKELEQLVKDEKFEEAAVVREKIKKLERKGDK